MATKNQIIEAVRTYIERDMLPHAPTKTDRFVLRGASAALVLRPDLLFKALASNPIVSMLGAVDGDGNVDIQLLRELLPAALGGETIDVHFKVFPWDVEECGSSLGAEDVKKIFTYM